MATTIQSVERAARILRFIADRPGAQASEIAHHMELAAPTTHHLLNTLVQEGLLRKDSHRRYELGPTCERIAERVYQQIRPPTELRPALNQLAARTGESCYLTAWRGERICVVAVAQGDYAVRVNELVVGFSGDIHARVGAQVLLAYAERQQRDWALADYDYRALTPNTVHNREELDRVLAEIRASGVAYDREQLHTGVAAISAPIFVDGEVRAALSLTAPAVRFARNSESYLESLRECAALPVPPGVH